MNKQETGFKKDFFEYIKFLQEMDLKFKVEYTHGRYSVISPLGISDFKKGNISNKGMNFIKSQKTRIINSGITEKIPMKTPEELGLKYIWFNKKYMGQNLTNIIELDLNSAYWQAAYKLNIITKKDFYKGLAYPKVERLASLGSLARTIRVREWTGKRWLRSYAKAGFESDDTRHVWFALCNEVDKLMRKCAKELGDDFLFYWIDALFFTNTKENKEKLGAIIKKAGYKFKFIKIKNVIMESDSAKVYSKDKGKIDAGSGLKLRFFCYDINNNSLFKK